MFASLNQHQKVLAVAMLLFPTFALFGNSSTIISVGVLLIVAIISLVKEKLPKPSYIKPLFITFLLVFILSLPNMIMDGGRLASLDVPSRYLFASVAILGLSYKHINIKYLFYGVFLSSIIGFIVYPVYVGFILDLPRYKGQLFGEDIKILYLAYQSMIHVSIASVGLYYFTKQQYKLGVLISIATICMSLTIGFMSGSKVVLLNFPIVAIFVFLSIKQLKFKGRMISLAACCLSLGLLIAIFPQTQIYERAKVDIRALDSQAKTSTNLRINMWKLSWMAFKDNPILGKGYNKMSEYRDQMIDAGAVNLLYSNNQGKESLHSELGNTAAKKGIVGLFFIFLLYIVPIYVSWKMYRSDSRNEFPFYLVCVLSITYFIAGLTEYLLMSTSPSVYFILILLLMLLTHHKEHLIKRT